MPALADARERGNELCRVDRAPAGSQVVAARGVVAGHAGEGVVAGRDVHDAGARESGLLSAPSRYSAGLIWPSRWRACWSARATIPDMIGVASLVPPKMYQPGSLTPGVSIPAKDM